MKQDLPSSEIQQQPLAPSNISVLLLAAGHGKRMRPLTDTVPKPLLKVGNYALIEHHVINLQHLGFRHLVINTAYLGEQIQHHLGTGEQFGVRIDYSDESQTGALETAGGIKKSLALLQSDSFIVINSDIYTDFDFSSLLKSNTTDLGRVVLVPNPSHNRSGDFVTDAEGNFNQQGDSTMTFSGIARYRKEMFASMPEGKLALGPILQKMCQQGTLSAVPYYGEWTDVGTPERLAQLNSLSITLKSQKRKD